MAVCHESISLEKCNQLLSACAGLAISRISRSVDTTILVDFGRLSKDPPLNRLSGRLSCMFECDWRVEKPRCIQFGSGYSDKQIDNRIETLKGAVVERVEVAGKIPEIALTLQDGRTIRTFTNWKSQPMWSIGFKDLALFPLHPLWNGIDVSPWISARTGRISIEYCYDERGPGVPEAIEQMGFK